MHWNDVAIRSNSTDANTKKPKTIGVQPLKAKIDRISNDHIIHRRHMGFASKTKPSRYEYKLFRGVIRIYY